MAQQRQKWVIYVLEGTYLQMYKMYLAFHS